MCGISALYKYTQVTDEDKHKLALMNNDMRYRGPDGEGFWNNTNCALTQIRLSIIGLDNGAQPLFNEDGSLVLVCNGEIYNYKELQSKLEANGHHFSSNSDNEVILHLYEDWGEQCLHRLRGMFAFCLYDTKKRRLFVARDRVGEKVLYYSQLPTGYVFTSELKAILKYYIPHPQINAKILLEPIRYCYPIDSRHTFINQIFRIQAGEYAIIDKDGATFHNYWEERFKPSFEGSVEDAKKKTTELIRESVSLCLQSDVPIGILLSGGIDSSAIAAFAKETGREVHVISAGYVGRHDCDERSVAKRFAKEMGLIYHEIELNSNDFHELFNEFLNYIDEPVCDVASIPQFALYKEAHKLGFKVLLGGLGGDEIFYGYPEHNLLADSLRIRKSHLDVSNWPMGKRKYLKFIRKNWKNVLFAGLSTMKIDDRIPVDWTYEDYRQFINDGELWTDGESIDLKNIDIHFSFPTDASIDTIYSHIFNCFMRNQTLYLADRLGMANNIEVRSPFVDYQLVDFVTSLPIDMKLPNGIAKGFLKDCLKGIVPDYILHAPKRGFEPAWDFVNNMTKEYQYKVIHSSHVFYNSMLADSLLYTLNIKQ